MHMGVSSLLPTQWPSRANLRVVSLIKLFIVHQKTNNLKSVYEGCDGESGRTKLLLASVHKPDARLGIYRCLGLGELSRY